MHEIVDGYAVDLIIKSIEGWEQGGNMGESKSGDIEVLVPTIEVGPSRGIAPRLVTLDGKVVGLLSNGKPHADQLLQMIVDNLKEKYKIRGVILESKPYLGNLAPKEILDKLTVSCDAVITGIGD